MVRESEEAFRITRNTCVRPCNHSIARLGAVLSSYYRYRTRNTHARNRTSKPSFISLGAFSKPRRSHTAEHESSGIVQRICVAPVSVTACMGRAALVALPAVRFRAAVCVRRHLGGRGTGKCVIRSIDSGLGAQYRPFVGASRWAWCLSRLETSRRSLTT